MKVENIIAAEKEAIRFLEKIKEVKRSVFNKNAFVKGTNNTQTYSSKETGALKRSSMDLTRVLSKMRNDTY